MTESLSQASLQSPYDGLPLVVQLGFVLALLVTVYSLVDLLVLRVNASRTRHRLDAEGASADEADFLWVFFVPALNEEVTIADSVSRLQAVEATHKIAVVIDDGSDDATPQILAAIDDPMVRVLRRDVPNARQGKAAALNDAWRYVHDEILRQPEHRDRLLAKVIVVIVDADGRLESTAPSRVVRHFSDPRIGGVQIQVRIYNRKQVLAWFQDVEFAIFGLVYQLGRAAWGTANMGGNGQFNRLAALDDVAGAEGPWRHRLTEDQDIGLRLIAAGWRGSHEPEATVSQQGLSRLWPLYRQRTRWAQGAWQAVGLMPTVRRADVSLAARIDMVGYLLLPVLQIVTALALLCAVGLAITLHIAFYSAAWPIIVFFIGATIGPGLIALMARQRGVRGLMLALLLFLPYACYAWLTFPAVVRGLGRQVVGKGSWAKTAREPLVDDVEVDAELPGSR